MRRRKKKFDMDKNLKVYKLMYKCVYVVWEIGI